MVDPFLGVALKLDANVANGVILEGFLRGSSSFGLVSCNDPLSKGVMGGIG